MADTAGIPDGWEVVDSGIPEGWEEVTGDDFISLSDPKKVEAYTKYAEVLSRTPPLGLGEQVAASKIPAQDRPLVKELVRRQYATDQSMKEAGYGARLVTSAVQGAIDFGTPIAKLVSEATGIAPALQQLDPDAERFKQELIAIREQTDPTIRPDTNLLGRGVQQASRMTFPMLMSVAAGRLTGGTAALAGAGRAGVSLATMAGTSGSFLPQTADQTYTALIAEGVPPDRAAKITAVSAPIEAAIESILPDPFKGSSGLFRGTARQVAANLVKQYTVNYAKELSEEGLQGIVNETAMEVGRVLDEQIPNQGIGNILMTEAIRFALLMPPSQRASNILMSGVESMQEAALPLALMMAPGAAVQSAGVVAESAARPGRLEELRAARGKGFVSADDGKKLGLSGATRQERLAEVDAEIQQLEQESKDAGTVPSPEAEVRQEQGGEDVRGRREEQVRPEPAGEVAPAPEVPVRRQPVARSGKLPPQTREEAARPEVQPLEEAAPESEPQPADPPIPEGMTRLYHGGAKGRYTGPAWYSTNRDYAANYRGVEELQYVDVPTEWVNEQSDPDGYGQTPDKGFTLNVELKNDEFGPRRPIAAPQAPAEPQAAPEAEAQQPATAPELTPELAKELDRLLRVEERQQSRPANTYDVGEAFKARRALHDAGFTATDIESMLEERREPAPEAPTAPQKPTEAAPEAQAVPEAVPEAAQEAKPAPEKRRGRKDQAIEVIESPGAKKDRSKGLAETGAFAEGDRVSFGDLTGTIRSIDPDGRASVNVDQIAAPGGVPIRRIEHWRLADLSKIEQTEEAEVPPARSPDVQLANTVADSLDVGETLDRGRVDSAAAQAYGGTRAEGAYDPSRSNDALELGVNLHIGRANKSKYSGPDANTAQAKQTVENLDALRKMIPAQTTRSGLKETAQQFSTPPAYAYAVNWIANITDSDTVLEPSAGTGSLVVHAKRAGAKVYVNELKEVAGKPNRRAELLREIGADQVFTEDAEQIGNVLSGKIKPTVVVMNPPFSTAAGRMQGKKLVGTDLKHIDAALSLLAPNGRLVAIIGAGLHGKSKTIQDWENSLPYDLRADVELGRDVYKGYGTTFPTRVLVIDKRAPTGKTIHGKAETLYDLIDQLEGVRNDRTHRAEPEPTRAESQKPAAEGEAGPRPESAVSTPARPVDAEGGQETGTAGRKGTGERASSGRLPGKPDAESSTSEGQKPAAGTGLPEGARGGRGTTSQGSRKGTGTEVGGKPVRESGEREPDAGPATQLDIEAVSPKRRKNELTESVYEAYEPRRVKIKGAKRHPASVVESSAMAAVDPPSIKYVPNLPQETVSSGALSEIQLETIAYAGHAHEQEIEIEGKKFRKGFLIGDGTGIGKGRTAAGIILDNIRQGRKKAVWVSKNTGLLTDSKEYSEAVGLPADKVFSHGNIKSGSGIDVADGVLYTTYSTMAGEASDQAVAAGNARSRLDQIVEWVGEDFDGAIIFDEAHIMRNAVDTEGARGKKKAAEVALAGVALQQRLPNARIVYMSATAATEVSNLAYAERLGLWGKGTAFANQTEFNTQITAGGVAAMEKVAADMKALGLYVSRNISFNDGTDKGTVEYKRLEHTLTPAEEAMYDKMAEAWGVVFSNMNEALEITDGEKNGRAISTARGQFWNANQRFWNNVLTAIQTPSVIKSIEADLKAGRSAVIQLTNTNEAASKRALANREEDQSLEELDMSPRGILMDYVERSFPVWQYEEYTDDNGNVKTRPAVDSHGNRIKNAEAVALQEQLLDEIGSIQLGSRGPLDMVIDHFGKDNVAEITGRTVRLVKDKDGKLAQESRTPTKNKADIKAFQSGKKRVLLFSEAGGTGASYHADMSSPNQQKRMHYLLQAGWRADVAVQGLGRTHRSNQAQAPSYALVHTNLKGQKRFISTIARRLSQLGAITKGERQAVTGGEGSALFTAADNLESTEAREALTRFYEDVVANAIPGVDLNLLQERLGLELLTEDGNLARALPPMTQFLNRVLSLPVKEQNTVFEAFEQRLQERVAIAQASGTLDQGIETVRADHITKHSDQVVYTHESGAETRYVKVTVARKTKPTQWATVQREWQPDFHVRSKRTGTVMAVAPRGTFEVDAKTGRLLERALAISPMGKTYSFTEKLQNEKNYDQLSKEDANKAWDEAVQAAPDFITTDEHFLTGVLLPIWNRIPGENTRVMRMLTDEGEMILGRKIPADQVQQTLKALGASTDTPTLSPSEAAEQVLDRNVELVLANGWRVQRRRVGGENRIELTGPSFVHHGELDAAGVFWERIQSKTRYFIPIDRAGDVLAEVLEGRPITDVISRAGRQEEEGEGIAKFTAPPTRQTRSTRRKSADDERGIAAADIQKTAERLFGVAIRQGGFSQRAAGVYKWLTGRKTPPSPEVVRTGEDFYASLGVVAHEIAHHIDETTKAVKGMPSEVKAEIKRLDYEPQKARAFEGWAEFMRRYLTEPPIDVNGQQVPNPGIDAPLTLAWFEGTFLPAHPELSVSIGAFRQHSQQFAQQSVWQRIGTLIADRQPQDLSFKEEWLRKQRRLVHRLKTNFVDKFHTLEWIQEKARELGHKGIGIYDLTMAYFMSASSHATIAFEEGVRSLQTGKPIGKTSLWGLRDHLESDGEYEDAVLYALARHTLFMAEKKPGYSTAMDLEDAEAWIAEVDADGKTDRFESFAQGLAQFNNDLLKMLVEAGALPADQAENMLRYYGGLNYFPLHRVQDVEQSMFAGYGVGFVNLGKAVRGRSAKGSGRQIIDPIDATVQQAIRFYGRAIQARQQHVLAETLDPKLGGVGGMGGLMDRVDPRKTVTHGKIEEILGTLVEEGVIEAGDAKAMRIAAKILHPEYGVPGEKSLAWFAERHGIEPVPRPPPPPGETAPDAEYDPDSLVAAAVQEPDALAVISLWRPDYTPNTQKRTVVIYDKNGQPLMYEMDPDLYATATGMDELHFGPFMSTFREAARWFKTGAVGASTGFGTANLLRDYWEFQGKARHAKGLASLGKPPEMLGRYVAEKARKLAGHKADDPLIRLYEESGGKVYSVIGHDVESRRRYRRRRIGKSTMSKLGISIERPLDTAESVLQGMMDVIAISDAPPRLADAEAAIREEGFEIREGQWFDVNADEVVDHLPEHVRIKAAVAMAEATINFKRIGAKGQYIESFMPFFNATMQAMYRQYGQIKGLKSLGKQDAEGTRAKRYMVYLSALAATGIVHWLLRHDDDDWREQDAYLRDNYWTWGRDGKTYVRIPKPRDTAIVSNLAENMLDAWYHDDARDTTDVVLRDFGGRLPTGGGLLRGTIEAFVADYDYFRDRELTPDYLKHLPKEQQVTPYTSRASDSIGRFTGRYLGTSPIQVEHLLSSASGGFYHRMADLYDASVDGRLGPEHIPFLRGLVIDRQQARSVSTFYDEMEDTRTAGYREAADGKVSDDTIRKQAVLEAHAELMTELRNLEGKVGKRRDYQYQPYIVGLARHSLGYEELDSNPNPLSDKDAPEQVKSVVRDYSMRVVDQATEPLKEKSEYASEEIYESQRQSLIRGKAKLDAIGLTYEQAQQLLTDYYVKRYGRLTESYNAKSVALAELYAE